METKEPTILTTDEAANRKEAVEKKVSDAKNVIKYGKTPVIYGPTRAMVRPQMLPGLSNLIAQATTIKEVNNLLEQGKTQYKKVSPATIRKWEIQSALKKEKLSPSV